jgi:hypothetical protein
MDHSIVSTSKAWYYMYAFRRSKTARHDVSAVQSVVEGTFFFFLVFGSENLDYSERDFTSKTRNEFHS